MNNLKSYICYDGNGQNAQRILATSLAKAKSIYQKHFAPLTALREISGYRAQ